MSALSGIEWTDATWNPVTGCDKVSEGCRYCYALNWAIRHMGEFSKDHNRKFGDVMFHSEKLILPITWKKPKRIFVNSMSDLFHEAVTNEQIYQVFSTMACASWHTYQILTKRPARMVEWFEWVQRENKQGQRPRVLQLSDKWPLPNVWIGVSVENQDALDERYPLLLGTPAAVRFLSCEPLLWELRLDREFMICKHWSFDGGDPNIYGKYHWEKQALVRAGFKIGIQWVIAGGESGTQARPMHPDWARSLRDQCVAAGVPFFFKQWGGRNKKSTGRLLDGREWNEMPKEAVVA